MGQLNELATEQDEDMTRSIIKSTFLTLVFSVGLHFSLMAGSVPYAFSVDKNYNTSAQYIISHEIVSLWICLAAFLPVVIFVIARIPAKFDKIKRTTLQGFQGGILIGLIVIVGNIYFEIQFLSSAASYVAHRQAG